MAVIIPQKRIDTFETTEVLVVGGGPAGIGAAVRAARQGKKVMLLEKRGFLGGNMTASFVESCNYFMRGTPFKPEGVFGDMEREYDKAFPSDDLRPNSPHRFHSEYLKVFLDDFIRREGITLKLHAFVNDVVMKDGQITAVVIQTKKGPQAVCAKVIIDCTGDGDVAFSAGVPFKQGRATDGLCQPGTVSVRLAGADTERLLEGGDYLRVLGKRFHDDYRAGKTGLQCKRQDLPFGRLTKAGIISYVNYACTYGLDPTDVDDLTRGETECRSYIMDIYHYMKKNFEGFENTEIAAMAPEIGFRDSRRIQGEYLLTIDDMESKTQFEDRIATYVRFYDMLSPDANMDGDGKVEGKGYKGHIYEHPTDDRTFQVPFRSLLPVNVDNLLVAGRCLSSEHVAQSGVRAISLCTMTGDAAGLAAAMAVRDHISPKKINVKELQKGLVAAGFTL